MAEEVDAQASSGFVGRRPSNATAAMPQVRSKVVAAAESRVEWAAGQRASPDMSSQMSCRGDWRRGSTRRCPSEERHKTAPPSSPLASPLSLPQTTFGRRLAHAKAAAAMLFFNANLFATGLAVLMAILVLTINVHGQRPGHDPFKPGPKPSPGYIVGKCCGGSHSCMEGCEDIQGKPDSGTKHDLGARESMPARR